MKAFLASALFAKSYYALWNINEDKSVRSGDSVSFTWEDHDNSGADSYRATLYDIYNNNTIAGAELVTDRAVSFNGLDAATEYSLVVEGYNSANGTVVNSNSAAGRTAGNAIIISNTWESGVNGRLLWDAVPGSCANSIKVFVPSGCVVTNPDFHGRQVTTAADGSLEFSYDENTDSQGFTLHGSNDPACNWADEAAYFTENVADAFAPAQADLAFDAVNSTVSWDNGTNKVTMFMVDIPEEYRENCPATVTISSSCADAILEPTNPGYIINFDDVSGNGPWVGSFSDKWQNHFGAFVAVPSTSDCDLPTSVAFTADYNVRN